MKISTPAPALAPYGSMKFWPLMTKIGQVKTPAAADRWSVDSCRSVQNPRLCSKVDVAKAPE